MKKSRIGKNALKNTSTTELIEIIDDPFIANAAIASSISPIAFVKCGTEKVLYANHAFLSIWGYKCSDQIIGKNASNFWHTEQLQGHVNRKLRDRGGWIGEITACRNGGAEFPVQVSTTMLMGKANNPLLQMFSFIEISDRVNAQLEQRRLLAELTERLKELDCLYNIANIQHSSDSTIESILRQIVAAIPPSLRWPERSYARIALGALDVCTPGFNPSSNSQISLPLQAGGETGRLDVGYYAEGQESGTMVFLAEERQLLEAAAREIERIIGKKCDEVELQINRERLLHADKLSSIGILSAEIMHEINNPNNFITINTKILSRAWKDALPILDMYCKETGDFSIAGLPFTEAREEVSRLLAGIADGSERIRTISSHLKAFLAKNDPAQFLPFSINVAVDKAIEFSRHNIDSSTDRFEVALLADNPLISGDYGKILQVVINLITNACQALATRNDRIRVSTDHHDGSNFVKVIVEDEGRGIHPHDLPHIMEPFFTTKNNRAGIGLGLSISNDIAINHGGKLLLHSIVNRGTRVELVLPTFTYTSGTLSNA